MRVWVLLLLATSCASAHHNPFHQPTDFSIHEFQQTPAYAVPVQIISAQSVAPTADLYSAPAPAAVLYSAPAPAAGLYSAPAAEPYSAPTPSIYTAPTPQILTATIAPAPQVYAVVTPAPQYGVENVEVQSYSAAISSVPSYSSNVYSLPSHSSQTSIQSHLAQSYSLPTFSSQSHSKQSYTLPVSSSKSFSAPSYSSKVYSPPRNSPQSYSSKGHSTQTYSSPSYSSKSKPELSYSTSSSQSYSAPSRATHTYSQHSAPASYVSSQNRLKNTFSKTSYSFPSSAITSSESSKFSYSPVKSHNVPQYSAVQFIPSVVQHGAPAVKYQLSDANQFSSSVKPVAILRQSQDDNFDGAFSYEFEAENGIASSASGYIKQLTPEEVAQVMQGQYSYTAPDGTPVVTRWFADETGFHAEGAHLPVAPPVPEAIAKSLKYQGVLAE